MITKILRLLGFGYDMKKVHPRKTIMSSQALIGERVDMVLEQFRAKVDACVVDVDKYGEVFGKFFKYVYKKDYNTFPEIRISAREVGRKVMNRVQQWNLKDEEGISISKVIDDLDFRRFRIRDICFEKGIKKMLKLLFDDGSRVYWILQEVFYKEKECVELISLLNYFISCNCMWNRKFADMNKGDLMVFYLVFLDAYNARTGNNTGYNETYGLVDVGMLFLEVFNMVKTKHGESMTVGNHVVDHLLFVDFCGSPGRNELFDLVSRRLGQFFDGNNNNMTNRIRLLHTYFNGGKLVMSNVARERSKLNDDEYIHFVEALEYTVLKIIEHFYKFGTRYEKTAKFLLGTEGKHDWDLVEWEEYFYSIYNCLELDNICDMDVFFVDGASVITETSNGINKLMSTKFQFYKEQFEFLEEFIYCLDKLTINFDEKKRYLNGVLDYLLAKNKSKLPYLCVVLTSNAMYDKIRRWHIDFLYWLHRVLGFGCLAVYEIVILGSFSQTVYGDNKDFLIKMEQDLVSSLEGFMGMKYRINYQI